MLISAHKETKIKSTDPILKLFLGMIKLNFDPGNLVDDLKNYNPLNTEKCISKVKLALTTNNFAGIHEIDELIPHRGIFTNYVYNSVYNAIKDSFKTIDPFINFMVGKTTNKDDISTIYHLCSQLISTAAQNNNLKLAKQAVGTIFNMRVELRHVTNIIGIVDKYRNISAGIVKICTYDQVLYVLGDEEIWKVVANWNPVIDRKIYEIVRKCYPFRKGILESAYRCMPPEEWLVELGKIDKNDVSDEQKIEIMEDTADKAFGAGYTYFSQIVKKELERVEISNFNGK